MKAIKNNKGKLLIGALLALVLVLGLGYVVTSASATTINVGALDWSVQYMIDQSQSVSGASQFSGPRDNRGLALSPDGRYLYAGYNNPTSGPSTKQVRKIDTTEPDYINATVAVLQGNRGKALATDDKGRVYMAEGSDTDAKDGAGIHIYDANLTTKLWTIPVGSTTGLAKPEGVATRREGGTLALYVTDRTNRTLTRFEITEGTGVTITGVAKAGFDGDGVITIVEASSLRGVEVDPSGRIWMADISANKVFRVNSDGTNQTSASVTTPIDIGFDDTQAFVTQYTARTITVLKQSDMSFVATLTPPWATLKLDLDGQSANGALSGIAIGPGPFFYVANEAGQTENEKSTYGRCDDQSDNPGGPCTITDQTHDDNEPILKTQVPDNQGPITSNVVAAPNPAPVNTTIDLTATVDDSTTGGSNIASAEYSLNGGPWTAMDAQDGAFDAVSEGVEATFSAPADAGIYDLCVRGTDEPGNIGDPECIMLVVYDPEGGFVTGGGWINSPEGACLYAECTVNTTGKATFGFVSKYKKGATVPTGNTEFQFKAGNLNFHSSSYQWLVVAGAKAQFKGDGTINGAGNYGFMLTALDAELTPSAEVDKFRIKIWDKENGDAIVYDNQMDDPDDADAGTEIGGGSIVIHTKK